MRKMEQFSGKVATMGEKEKNKKDLKEKIFLPYWAETTAKLVYRWETEHKEKVELKEYLNEICIALLGKDKYEKIKRGVKK